MILFVPSSFWRVQKYLFIFSLSFFLAEIAAHVQLVMARGYLTMAEVTAAYVRVLEAFIDHTIPHYRQSVFFFRSICTLTVRCVVSGEKSLSAVLFRYRLA